MDGFGNIVFLLVAVISGESGEESNNGRVVLAARGRLDLLSVLPSGVAVKKHGRHF